MDRYLYMQYCNAQVAIILQLVYGFHTQIDTRDMTHATRYGISLGQIVTEMEAAKLQTANRGRGSKLLPRRRGLGKGMTSPADVNER